MIDNLLELAKDIEDTWTEGASFSELCFEKLATFENSLTLNEFEDAISQWTLKGDLPKQLNVYDAFGQPPVTVFNNGKFVLDLYFWMNIDTSIHSHAFSGAFKVLYGRSLHEEFTIKPVKNFGPDMMIADFSQNSVEVLKGQDCREIIQGNDFNHRLIHLDTPTITLCARTINDDHISQWHHFPNGLSVEKKELSQDVLKCLYYYNYLFNRNPEKGYTYLVDIISKWDLSSLLNLYEKLSMESMGISDEAIETFFNLFQTKFGETEWFKLYVVFYSSLEESYVELEGDSAATRFLEHALMTKYSKEKAAELLIEIQNAPLSDQQKEILSLSLI